MSRKERPIIFSGPMVRAILDGRKTQTRRVIRFPRRGSIVFQEIADGSWWPYESDDGETALCSDGCEHPMRCPFGGPGDRLWVREAILQPYATTQMPSGEHEGFWSGGTNDIRYVADGATPEWTAVDERGVPFIGSSWRAVRPSIHMPRWASRITLEVTGVRVERLQQLTQDDAGAEGGFNVMGFSVGWDTLHKPGAQWSDNPWVWVVEFRRIEA